MVFLLTVKHIACDLNHQNITPFFQVLLCLLPRNDWRIGTLLVHTETLQRRRPRAQSARLSRPFHRTCSRKKFRESSSPHPPRKPHQTGAEQRDKWNLYSSWHQLHLPSKQLKCCRGSNSSNEMWLWRMRPRTDDQRGGGRSPKRLQPSNHQVQHAIL